MEQLIYNRRATDFYGYADLNRVESWIQSLYKRIVSLGYSPIVKSPKVWDDSSIPRQSAIDAIRQSIVNLRDSVLESAPDQWRYYNSVGYTKTDKTEWDSWEWDLQLISDYVDAAITDMTFREADTIFMISGGVFN